MGRSSMSFAAVGAALIVAVSLLDVTAAATYIVGDASGWRVPAGPNDYATWASNHTFVVGDILVFNFATGQHDVATVTRNAYDNCNTNGPISLQTFGPANVTLNSTGPEFFICTFGTHCSSGQKLAINVTSSNPPTPSPTPTPTPTPTPSPTPAPTPTPTPTPAPTPSSTPSPTPSSSSPSPSPSGVETPPPPPTGGTTPSGSPAPPTAPTGSVTPPPPPSSAPTTATSTIFVILISFALAIMMS